MARKYNSIKNNARMLGLSAIIAGSSIINSGCASLDYAHRTRPVDDPKTPYEKFCNERLKERIERKELNQSKTRPIVHSLVYLMWGYFLNDCLGSKSSSDSSPYINQEDGGSIGGGGR